MRLLFNEEFLVLFRSSRLPQPTHSCRVNPKPMIRRKKWWRLTREDKLWRRRKNQWRWKKEMEVKEKWRKASRLSRSLSRLRTFPLLR